MVGKYDLTATLFIHKATLSLLLKTFMLPDIHSKLVAFSLAQWEVPKEHHTHNGAQFITVNNSGSRRIVSTMQVDLAHLNG